MNKVIAIVATAAAVTAAPQLMFDKQSVNLSSNLDMSSKVEDLFMAWSKKFGKTYSQVQQSAKLATFKDNAALINSHNAQYEKGLQSYTMALNQFSDLSADEFKAKHLSEYKPTRERSETVLDTSNVAASADWRTKGAVTPIKDQGTCGSCWAFSTTGGLEGRWQIAGNKLTSLSEQQLMDCSVPEGDNSCQGGFMDYGFQYIIDNKGIDTEADYPYKMRNEPCEHNKEKNVAATVASFTDVPKGNEAQLEAAVAQGPVSVAIEADQSGFQHYKSGIFSGKCGDALDHGVVAVGYSKDYWIVKNSWGTTWGDAGYIKISRAANLCGIQNAATYPTAGAKAAPAIPAIPVADDAKWTSITQSVFQGPQKCNGSGQDTSFPIGKCIPDQNGSFKMACSADGKKFVQSQYSDPACSSLNRNVPGSAGTCYTVGAMQYVSFTCATTADHVEIAQN